LARDDAGADVPTWTELDRLVHEPARLAILVQLSFVGEADFLYLLRRTGLTKGNLSSHLSKLEDAGYVAIDKAFVGKTPRTRLALTERGRAAFARYRAQLGALLEGSGA
jgi:DNA-binding MarR family transcriptional regulator